MSAKIRIRKSDWRFFVIAFILSFFSCVIWIQFNPLELDTFFSLFANETPGLIHYSIFSFSVGVVSMIYLPDFYREPKPIFPVLTSGFFAGLSCWVLLGILLTAFYTFFGGNVDGSIFEKAFFYYFLRMLRSAMTFSTSIYYVLAGVIVVGAINFLGFRRKSEIGSE